MCKATPAQAIRDLLMREDFVEQRKQLLDKEQDNESGPILDLSDFL
jgi:hypothetical protein